MWSDFLKIPEIQVYVAWNSERICFTKEDILFLVADILILLLTEFCFDLP
jgi:hypothetical protein